MNTSTMQRRQLPRWCWNALAIIAVEVLSYCGWVTPTINTIVFIVLCVFTAVLSMKKLEWGIVIMATELIIGSKGYLFSIQLFGISFSIRIALFLIVFAASVVWMIRQRTVQIIHWKFLRPYLGLIAMVILGVLIGSTSNDLQTLFLDANGYLFLGAAVPLVQAIRTERQWKILQTVCTVAVSALAVKTFIVVLLFSHDLSFLYTLPGVYKWIRDTGVGEITRFPNGFVRVFFQSHLYVIAAFFAFWSKIVVPLQQQSLRNTLRQHPWAHIAVAAMFAVIVLSYSRSFWMSTALTSLLVILWLVIYYRSIAVLAKICAQFLLCAIGAALIITFLIRLPLPGQKNISITSLINDRTADISSEPAASSRWQLLGPLWRQIQKHPLLGSGFGATLTYTSNDPRVREQHPDGRYTTYAFEWGYLDILMKVGAVGAVLIALFLWQLGNSLFQQEWSAQNNRQLPLYSSIFALLLITHVFTPYLNHPIGIGLLLYLALALTIRPQNKSFL